MERFLSKLILFIIDKINGNSKGFREAVTFNVFGHPTRGKEVLILKVHGNLNDLLAENKKAKRFFLSLPDYVQGAISQRVDSIDSLESLQAHAHHLMQGND